jgi:nucleoside-diphosphate-sugar epimerase
MNGTPDILLTGATGLLGRYLLRDLLASGHRVTVLVRDSGKAAAERIAELLAFWEESGGRGLAQPAVVVGDLALPGLGLGPAERRRLATPGRTVVHAAACVSSQPTVDGEPWETNFHGTRRLLELCRSLGLAEFHHVSTAFICGERRGVVRENELDCGHSPGNAYEHSKFAAEQLVRRFHGVRATIYRPSVVVGDSRTGYTSTYHHLYRFLELAVRLSAPAAESFGPGKEAPPRRVSVRLPLTGDETLNLVPVDWVSRAVVALLHLPAWHGHTFHLVAREGVRLREVKAIIAELLPLEGIEWAGTEGVTEPTPLEQRILEQFRDYWRYLQSDLVFDCQNTRQALPNLPPPRFERELAARLLNFARTDQWGRGRPPAGCPDVRPGYDCAFFLENVVAEEVQRSMLARVLPGDLSFAVDIRGAGGGQWSFRRGRSRPVEVQRGADPGAAVTYRTDAATFADLVRGRHTAQQAFFDGRIEMAGNMEKALTLAVLIEQFLLELVGSSMSPAETVYGAAGR